MKKLRENTENPELPDEKEKNQNEQEWEINHAEIGNSMIQYLLKYGSMPNKSVLSEITGLSRETVYKHLRDYAENPVKQITMEGFEVMNEHVIAQVLRNALRGDMKAAKLYLEIAGIAKPKSSQQPSQQNNYLQLNKTIINQQIIQQLKPEQLEQIEQIIAASELKKEERG